MSLDYLSFFVGSGFPDASLARASDVRLDFIGADAGTIDVGPYQLAGQGTIFSADLCRHDLRRVLPLARAKGVPLVIGSCGGSGSDWGVDWVAEMVREVAREQALAPFKVAMIYAEPDRDYLADKIAAGRVHPLGGTPVAFDEDTVRRSTKIVGVMGAEPFIAALEAGADVVLAGRATDTAIFAALPLMRGISPSIAWHAAKIAECGGAIADPARNDLLLVQLEEVSYDVAPMAEDSRCTPWSISAHQLYENSDPTTFVEPSGTIACGDVRYEQCGPKTVRVSGARFEPAAQHTIKLEGVEPAGYQSVAVASYSDRVLLDELPDYMVRARAEIETKIRRVYGDKADEAVLTIRTYGAGNGADLFGLQPIGVPANDVCFILDVVAPTQEVATSMATVAWHTLIHFPPQGWTGSFVTAAWPFNPPVIERGMQYRFNVNHVIEVDDPLECFRTEYEVIGQ
jgi:hypothetical protein